MPNRDSIYGRNILISSVLYDIKITTISLYWLTHAQYIDWKCIR